jgi:hypothetical protein
VTTPIGRASWIGTAHDGGHCEISDRQENILSLNAMTVQIRLTSGTKPKAKWAALKNRIVVS